MTINERRRPVVAGVDYSNLNTAALDYAATEASRRGLGLRLVNAFVPAQLGETPAGPPYDENQMLVAAEEYLSEAVLGVRTRHPDLLMSTKVVAGPAAATLIEESASAALVVVGARGSGGFPGLLLGSVAAQISQHSRCPAIVVRPPRIPSDPIPGSGPVLVGIDDSVAAGEVLGFGFEEAAARGVPLIVVHVWSIPAVSARSFGTIWSRNPRKARAQLRHVAEEVLAEALSGWPDKYPQVSVEPVTAHGDEPARTLLEIAEQSEVDLIVVGSRPREGLPEVVFGSVSQAVVMHAQASVVVLHPAHAG